MRVNMTACPAAAGKAWARARRTTDDISGEVALVTGSHERALFTGRRDAGFAWFSLAASLPLVSMDAERAARQLMAAVRAQRPEVILTPAHLAALPPLAPGLTSRILNRAQRLLLPPQARQVASRTGAAAAPGCCAGTRLHS